MEGTNGAMQPSLKALNMRCPIVRWTNAGRGGRKQGKGTEGSVQHRDRANGKEKIGAGAVGRPKAHRYTAEGNAAGGKVQKQDIRHSFSPLSFFLLV